MAACYLAAMLAEATPRGQPSGVAVEVQFQRLYAGQPLDDLIVVSRPPTGVARLALQVKRDLAFGEQDPRFDEVIRACWETYGSSGFNRTLDRFGVALGLYTKVIDEHYQRVLHWARRSASAADFGSRIAQEGLSSAHQRSFHALIRGKLQAFSNGAATDDDVWDFLRHMVLLHFDLEVEGSRDRQLANEYLRHVLPGGPGSGPGGLFDRLGRIAADTAAAAGSLNLAGLRDLLSAEGVTLLAPPDLHGDRTRLAGEARNVLAGIRQDIAGLVFDRTDVVSAVEEMLTGGGIVEITGAPGAGKSNILRSVAERQSSDDPLFVLSGERLNSVHGLGWNAVASDLRLEHPLGAILSGLPGGSRPRVYIDGVDRVTTASGRAAVNDILGAIAERAAEGGLPWTVVLTVREENLRELHDWLAWHHLGPPRSARVPPLTLEEVLLVASKVPRLAPLLVRPHLLPVLTSAFFLRVLTDPRILAGHETESRIATEVEVRDLWWGRLVGAGGEGRDRQRALLGFARMAAPSPGAMFLPDSGVSGDVLLGLESDGIVVREPGRDLYRFGHDVYEDWVLSRLLDQHMDDLPGLLRSLGQPLGLLRPLQLVVLSMVERTRDTARWLRLLDQFPADSDLRPRWRQALLLAPLLSGASRDLLDSARDALFANDGALLVELLRALRTVEVLPNLDYLAGAARVAGSPGELLSLLLVEPIPVVTVWVQALAWLTPHLAEVPESARVEAAEAMLVWQRGTRPGAAFRREIGTQASAWLAPFDEWRLNRGRRRAAEGEGSTPEAES